MREYHVRICEGLGVKFPGSTRHKPTYAAQQIAPFDYLISKQLHGVGTSRPSALAVFMLMTSSNLVGCSTGRSAGFAPLRNSTGLNTDLTISVYTLGIHPFISPPASTISRYG